MISGLHNGIIIDIPIEKTSLHLFKPMLYCEQVLEYLNLRTRLGI